MDWQKTTQSRKLFGVINFVLILVLVSVLGINQVTIAKTYDALGIKENTLKKFASSVIKGTSSNSANIGLTGNANEDAIKLVISQGVPEKLLA